MGLRRRRLTGPPLVGATTVSLILGLTMAAVSAQANEPVDDSEPADGLGPAEQKVQPDLAEAFESDSRTDFWVRLGERPDFGTAREITDWAERGTAVATGLKQAAESSQGDVLDVLDEAGIDHEAFWITNAVYVYDGTAELADRMETLAEAEQPIASRDFAEDRMYM
jgi:hypothetical protein